MMILDRRTRTNRKAPPPADTGVLRRVLTPMPGHERFALADGGPLRRAATAADVSAGQIAETVEKATTADTLLGIEHQILQRIEQVRAVAAVARGATSATEFQERAQVRAQHAGWLHFSNMSAALKLTRPVEVTANEHHSFFSEAQIPPSDARLRGSIVLRVVPGGLLADTAFGTAELCGPLEGIGDVHIHGYGLIVTSFPATLNDQVVRLGSVAGAHRSLIYVPLPPARLNCLEQVLQDKPGEENVVLVSAPIRVRRASVYEKGEGDVVISAAAASAGMEVRKMAVSPEHGLGSSVTGCGSVFCISTAYGLYDEHGPLVENWGVHFSDMPAQVQVGASATNYMTEATSNVNLYGNHVARGAHPTYQIQVRFTMNHIARKLKIHGHRLLVPVTQRPAVVREMIKELKLELVGAPPKPLQGVDLVEDRESPEGLAALAAGGVMLKAIVKINARTEFVQFAILPVTGGPPPAQGNI